MARRRSYTPARVRTRTVVKRVRSGPSPKLVKARVSAAAKSAAARARKAGERGDMYALAAALGLGLAARKGVEIPAIGELGTAGTVGAAMWAAPMLIKGKMGADLRRASVGPLSVALHELAEDSEMFSFID